MKKVRTLFALVMLTSPLYAEKIGKVAKETSDSFKKTAQQIEAGEISGAAISKGLTDHFLKSNKDGMFYDWYVYDKKDVGDLILNFYAFTMISPERDQAFAQMNKDVGNILKFFFKDSILATVTIQDQDKFQKDFAELMGQIGKLMSEVFTETEGPDYWGQIREFIDQLMKTAFPNIQQPLPDITEIELADLISVVN